MESGKEVQAVEQPQAAVADETAIPADKINLRLLLSNGMKADFIFAPSESVAVIKQHIHTNWPAGTLCAEI